MRCRPIKKSITKNKILPTTKETTTKQPTYIQIQDIKHHVSTYSDINTDDFFQLHSVK